VPGLVAPTARETTAADFAAAAAVAKISANFIELQLATVCSNAVWERPKFLRKVTKN
jgi:hypothetical protein